MIIANFNAYDTYVTDSLYQWDINQVLKVSGLNLTSDPEVHFSNANVDRAIVKQADYIDRIVTVSIPNSLLQDPLKIEAHIGVYEGDTFKVIEKVIIPVIPRKRPFDYQIQDSDEEIYSFKALENKLNNVIDNINAQMLAQQASIESALVNLAVEDGSTTVVASTMMATKWTSNKYSFEDIYPVGSYNIEIALNSTATIEQANAFNNAQIVGSATSNIVTAYGPVPTVDIPIIIRVVAL